MGAKTSSAGSAKTAAAQRKAYKVYMYSSGKEGPEGHSMGRPCHCYGRHSSAREAIGRGSGACFKIIYQEISQFI